MAEVAEEQARLEAEFAAEEREREQIQADFLAEQEAMHAQIRYAALKEVCNGPPIIVREKTRGGLVVTPNQPMLTAFFVEENLILWEPKLDSFFVYSEKKGIWEDETEDVVLPSRLIFALKTRRVLARGYGWLLSILYISAPAARNAPIA